MKQPHRTPVAAWVELIGGAVCFIFTLTLSLTIATTSWHDAEQIGCGGSNTSAVEAIADIENTQTSSVRSGTLGHRKYSKYH